ncbi:hypothetical protein BCA37_25525 [Mycobacterium sp. djl-10]|nr:hypothetical protein BCA37_25525 [Mycobacterium sp. djl-10]
MAGLYSLFGFSFATAGPAMIWGWVAVSVVALFMCLCWAELSSHMPLAGSLYHWTRAVAGPVAGWWVGWMYLLALILLVAGWFFIIPTTLGPLLGVEFTSLQSALVVLAAIGLAAVINGIGIEVLGKFATLGTILELIVGLVLTGWLFVAADLQPVSIFFDLGEAASLAQWWPMLFGGGIFVAVWVLFAFEFAGAVGEETEDPHRAAPRGVMLALVGTLIVGTLTLAAFILAVPDVETIAASATPVPDIFNAWLPAWVAKAYLILLLWIEILGTNAFFAAVSRQLFGMARAGQLPMSEVLSRTRNGRPYVAVVVVAIIALIPLIFSQQMSVLASGATACAFATYTVVLVAVLIGRFRGWPHTPAPFALGRAGIPVNLVAAAGALGILVLLLWPSDNTNPEFGGIRVAYWLLGGILLSGLVVFLAGRRKLIGADLEQVRLRGRDERGIDQSRLR